MKILVGYKRVVDYNVRIQVKPDGSGVVTDGVKLSPNPFDEIALEEALRLRDKGIATEVIVATIGPPTRRRTCATAWRWAPTARSTSSPTEPDPAADRRAHAAQADREGAAGPRDPRQAGDRRRRQPDRADAGGAVGPPAGDVRLKIEIDDGKAHGHARSRCRSGDDRSRPAGRGHHRPAPQRAALHQAAGHHEGQEQAAARRSRSPTSASKPATRSRPRTTRRRRNAARA